MSVGKMFDRVPAPVGALLIVAMAVGGIALVKGSPKGSPSASKPVNTGAKVPVAQSQDSSFAKVFNQYGKTHHEKGRDVYWLRGSESLSNQLKLLEHWEPLFRTLLGKYRDVSPLSQRIYERFKNFVVSEFFQGISRRPMRGNIADASGTLHEGEAANSLEVCVIPENEWLQGGMKKFPSSLYYRQEWGAVMFTALERPTVIMAALFYHELGHALRHRVDHAASATAPPMSDLWVMEEMEMHELEYEIMDKGTDGKFTQLLDTILSRVQDRGRPPAVLNAVTSEDLEAFDRLFDLQDAGSEVISPIIAQFVICLLLRDANTMPGVDPARLATIKLNLYRGVTAML